MAKNKKTDLKMPDPVELIDRIPSENIDLEALGTYCENALRAIQEDRDEWEDRRLRYTEILENLVDFDMGEAPYEGASNLHIPIVMEKVRASHARFFQAIFSLAQPFYVEPQEKIDEKRIKRIELLMKWALSRYVNNYKGIEDVMDDAILNFTAEGWCFLRLRWERKMRKALVVKEELVKPKGKPKEAKLEEDGSVKMEPTVRFREEYEWQKVFEGPMLENIAQENVYMPGNYDIQEAPLVAIKMKMSGHELRMGAATGLYNKMSVAKVLEHEENPYSTGYDDSTQIAEAKGYMQGVRTSDAQAVRRDPQDRVDEFNVFECYATFDIDGDGFDEEVICWFHRPSRQVIRWTYLDRVTKTGRRNIYKADYIRRPGRPYGIGLEELLYSINMEFNIIHNQKVDYGTISNMPFFFYDSSSGLPNYPIDLKPGQGTPVDDVGGISFPQIKGGTAFGFQEENLLYQTASRISGITDLNLGAVGPTPGDAVRSQGQLAALLNEGNATLDISLRRLQRMLSEVYSDIHTMLIDKLPKQFEHLVIGQDGEVAMDPQTGEPMMQNFEDTRTEIAGRVHFNIKANSASGNKVLMRSSRMETMQLLRDPLAIQMGLVTPENLYNAYMSYLESSDELDPERFLTKPENAMRPLSLEEEIAHIRQGLAPDIVLNDDHKAKAEALQIWMNAPQTVEGINLGNINPNAPVVGINAIQKHLGLLQDIANQQQQMATAQGLPQAAMANQLQQQAPQGGTGEQASNGPPANAGG